MSLAGLRCLLRWCVGLLRRINLHCLIAFCLLWNEIWWAQRRWVLVWQCRSLGLPPSPLCARLKRGESVTLDNGTVIHPHEVVGPKIPGRKVVILGDTCNSKQIAPFAENADVRSRMHERTTADVVEHLIRVATLLSVIFWL